MLQFHYTWKVRTVKMYPFESISYCLFIKSGLKTRCFIRKKGLCLTYGQSALLKCLFFKQKNAKDDPFAYAC